MEFFCLGASLSEHFLLFLLQDRYYYLHSLTGRFFTFLQLRQITVNDLPVGRNVDEILRLVKAFQFVDVHGEVCPANWHPGDATMVADPEKSKEYFSAAHSSKTGRLRHCMYIAQCYSQVLCRSI